MREEKCKQSFMMSKTIEMIGSIISFFIRSRFELNRIIWVSTEKCDSALRCYLSCCYNCSNDEMMEEFKSSL